MTIKQKSEFYKNKKLCKMDDIDVDKILVSNKGKYSTYKSIKSCAGYIENDEIRPLCIILSQMIGHVKC